MVSMEMPVISLVELHGTVTARARALAPAAGAEIWIQVVFKSSAQEPWSEARDRVLAMLDMS